MLIVCCACQTRNQTEVCCVENHGVTHYAKLVTIQLGNTDWESKTRENNRWDRARVVRHVRRLQKL